MNFLTLQKMLIIMLYDYDINNCNVSYNLIFIFHVINMIFKCTVPFYLNKTLQKQIQHFYESPF